MRFKLMEKLILFFLYWVVYPSMPSYLHSSIAFWFSICSMLLNISNDNQNLGRGVPYFVSAIRGVFWICRSCWDSASWLYGNTNLSCLSWWVAFVCLYLETLVFLCFSVCPWQWYSCEVLVVNYDICFLWNAREVGPRYEWDSHNTLRPLIWLPLCFKVDVFVLPGI